MLRDSQTGKWRWKRILLVGGLVAALGGAAATYVGYRVLFAKNPEVVREIQQSADRQQELDDLFADPAPSDQEATN